MRKIILAALVCLAMLITALPAAASEPIRFGHTWGTQFYEDAYAVDVDSSGNLYLSGTILGTVNNPNYSTFVAKVNIYGQKMWDIHLSSQTRGLTLTDTALGPSNSLYVVGSYYEVSTYDAGTYYAKVSSSGSVVYQKYLSGLDIPNRICANTGGNGFIIVGDTTSYGTGAVVAVKDDGSISWATSVSSPDGESPWAAVTDSSGAVYTFIDSSSDANVAIAKFSKTGRVVAQKVLLTDSPNDEYTWDMALGRDGNIYALGANYGKGELLMASFTPKLDLRWDEYVGTPTDGYEATRLVVASDGSLYAIGYTTFTSTGDPGPAIFHFSTTGAVLDATLYASAPSYGSFGMNDACAYPSGGVVVAGGSYGYPKATPVDIDWVTITEIPNDAWTADNTAWSKLSLKTVSGDLTYGSNIGAMDNYANDQLSQAWYGVINPPPPAFKSGISVKSTQDQSVLSFRGSASGGRSPYAYEWYFDDGSKASGQTLEHQYAIGGTYNVFLVVTDAKGQVSWATTVASIPVYPVIAALYHTPEPAYIGSNVYFNVSAYDPDGGSLSYFWIFGDGASLSTFEPYANHAYSAQGTYVSSVTVTNDEGLSTSASQSVTVIQYVNKAPYAQFNYYPITPYAGTSVTFDASPSYDLDGWIVGYSWNFGDATSASGLLVYHTYTSAGTYYVTLTVTDNLGATGFQGKYVTVTLPGPVASFSAKVVGSTVFVNATSSTSAAGIATYTWNWGDGSPVQVFSDPYASHTYAGANSTSLVGVPAISVGSVVSGPPPVPYYAIGYVTTLDWTPVMCNVSISNLRTGDVANTTTDQYGFYLYDLSSMQYGWMAGDVIHVFATNGVMSGANMGVANSSYGFLAINVTVQPTGPVGYYVISLTVADWLGQKDSTSMGVWVGSQGGEREVIYEISHFFESYLKNPDLTIQGNRTATPGLNSWWYQRVSAYGELIVRDTYPFVTAYTLESIFTTPDVDPGFGLQTMARMHIVAKNLTTVGTNVGKDPIFIPVLNPAVGGGTVTLQWRSDVMSLAEVNAIRATTSNYFARTYYGASRLTITDDGEWNQLYGHMTFDRLASRTYLGLPGSGDLRTEFTTANSGNAIGLAWWNDWLTETGAGGIYDIASAYGYSNDIRQLVLTLDPISTADHLNIRIWSLSWGNDMMIMRYMDVCGINSNMGSWFEDMYLNATIGPTGGNIETSYYMQYAMHGWADATTGKAAWMLEATHVDFIGSSYPPPAWQSRFNPYDPDRTNWMRTSLLPGTVKYGQQVSYYSTPMFWNLKSGEKMTIKLPTANAVGFEPYVGASNALNTAKATELNSHAYLGNLVLGNSSGNLKPYYNSATKTITLVGPTYFARNPNPSNPLINYTGVPQFVFEVSQFQDSPPVASFTLTLNGLTARVDASGSIDDLGIVSYSWNWSDGSPSGGGRTANHTYSGFYYYSITLTVMDTAGQTNSVTRDNIFGVGSLPVALFTGVVGSDGMLTVDASSSTAPGGIYRYDWNFGDHIISWGVTHTHIYVGTGSHNVTLTVTGNLGQKASITHSFYVVHSGIPPTPFTVFGYLTSGGAPVSGAQVNVTNVRTSETMIDIVSDTDGFYYVNDIMPLWFLTGDMAVFAAASGELSGSVPVVLNIGGPPYLVLDMQLA